MLLLLLGCAGGGEAARRDVDALRAEVRALQRHNEDLGRRVDALASRVEALSAQPARTGDGDGEERRAATPAAPLVPPDLAVVRIEPAPRGRGAPPPVPTAVPIAEPDPERLEALAEPTRRELAAEADGELRRARGRTGAARAHALEAFVVRYPRHPSADNALLEASAAYADAGIEEAACELARRASGDYPAGDAMSDALERLAWCESRRGSSDAERRLLERLVQEFPRTPAAERAGPRLATLSGRSGDLPPPVPPRSGP